jgi:plastocyanin
VRISEFMFIPNPVVISRGGTVTWVNEDSARHSIVGVGFRSDDMLKGGTYSRTYEQAGNFPYHCGIHPLMKGEVRVK